MTASLGFCYRHGLLAIGDEYENLRHIQLPAELRTLLEFTKLTAMLRLPDNPRGWPDRDELRSHRVRYGY